MRHLKKFKEVSVDYYYRNTDNPEALSKRDIKTMIDFSERNGWVWEERTKESEFQIEFSKQDYYYTINVDRQYDEYYLVNILMEDYSDPKNDDEKFLLLDSDVELKEFLEKIEKFYKHKRLYNIKSI